MQVTYKLLLHGNIAICLVRTVKKYITEGGRFQIMKYILSQYTLSLIKYIYFKHLLKFRLIVVHEIMSFLEV